MSELDYDFDYNSDIRVDLNQNGYTDGRLVGISRDELDSVFAEGLVYILPPLVPSVELTTTIPDLHSLLIMTYTVILSLRGQE